MSVYNSDYWKMPVLAQKFMGVWPFNNREYDKCMRVFVYISLYSLIIPLVSVIFNAIDHSSFCASINIYIF